MPFSNRRDGADYPALSRIERGYIMLYLVKTIDTHEWDEQDQSADEMSNQGWFRNSSEAKPVYHVLNDKDYDDLCDACIPDDPEHYTQVIVLAKVEREDLIGIINAMVPQEEPRESPCDGCYPGECIGYSPCDGCNGNGR
jgi:hypothetical protein